MLIKWTHKVAIDALLIAGLLFTTNNANVCFCSAVLNCVWDFTLLAGMFCLKL